MGVRILQGSLRFNKIFVSKVKKVLIDLLKLSNLNCGLGQVALNFGKELSKLDTTFEKHFLVPEKYIGYFGENIFYHTTDKVLSHQFDLWHCIHQQPYLLPNKNTKILLTIHDLNFLWEKNKIKSFLKLKKLQKLVKKVDYITFISNFTKKIVLENLNIYQIPNQVIYNGVTVKIPDIQPKSKKQFLFSIGVFKPKKNFHSLIYMMQFLPEYKLIIAGDNKGKYFKKIKKSTNKLNLNDRIIFAGKITDEEKYKYYAECLAFVFPSLYEGFGLPIIEAMNYYCPVITSKYTSLPEIGKEYVYYFDSFDPKKLAEIVKDSIKSFYSNEIKFNQQQQYAKQYNWVKNVNEYLQIYEKLLS